MIPAPRHPRQYAMIGDVYIPNTESLSDDEILRRAGTYVEAGDDPIVRHDCCPLCGVPAPCKIRRSVTRRAEEQE